MTVYDPVEATSPYDINLVLRKTLNIFMPNTKT